MGNGLSRLVILLVVAFGCRVETDPAPTRVLTGAQVLAGRDFEDLDGLRVGLITNHTARVDSTHLIDRLHAAPNVDLVALFGPEHGLRGSAEAGDQVDDQIDDATGIPVFSLYGSVDRPTPEMLTGVDALVFDIQDVGARFYTYISTMGRGMQSAAEAGIPFFVLDRPNPLGGRRVDGFVRDSLHVSGVGLYPIPIQHGMTVGELALMIQGEDMLEGLENLDLRVVRMQNWHRNMLWPDLDRDWIPTSPNIPSFETALAYPGTCLFEGTIISEGRGTDSPFLTIGAPWLDSQAVATELNGAGLPGVRFSSETVEPVSIPGVAENPKYRDEPIQSVRIHVMQTDSYAPVPTGIALLTAIYQRTPESIRDGFFNQRWLSLLAGSDRLQRQIESDITPFEIASSWREEVDAFTQLRSKYLRYE